MRTVFISKHTHSVSLFWWSSTDGGGFVLLSVSWKQKLLWQSLSIISSLCQSGWACVFGHQLFSLSGFGCVFLPGVLVVSIRRLFLHSSGQNRPKNCISVTHEHTPPRLNRCGARMHGKTTAGESRKWEGLAGNVVWSAVKRDDDKCVSELSVYTTVCLFCKPRLHLFDQTCCKKCEKITI